MTNQFRVTEFKHVKLAALGAVLPAERISLLDELLELGASRESAKRMSDVSGFESRRVAPEGITAADLCQQAAERILSDRDLSLIDGIIFLSESPDYQTPATASILQDKLGLSQQCAAFDMTAACSGYIHALWVASGLIESGACRSILICAGNATARFYNPANRIIAPLFGDAGTATLLTYSQQESPMSFAMGNDGSKAELFICPSGGARIPPVANESPNAPYNETVLDGNGNPWTLGGYAQCWMNGMELFRAVVARVPDHLKKHLEIAQMQVGSLDGIVLHQGNRLMVETIAKKLGAEPGQASWHALRAYGNQMCASLPVVICDEYCAEINQGKPLTLLLGGYGAGFSLGSCLVNIKDARCFGISDYIPVQPPVSRQELIARWHGIFKGRTL